MSVDYWRNIKNFTEYSTPAKYRVFGKIGIQVTASAYCYGRCNSEKGAIHILKNVKNSKEYLRAQQHQRDDYFWIERWDEGDVTRELLSQLVHRSTENEEMIEWVTEEIIKRT